MEAFRLAGVRLRDGEDMGTRPPVCEDVDALRGLTKKGWVTMQKILAAFNEAWLLPPDVASLPDQEQVGGGTHSRKNVAC